MRAACPRDPAKGRVAAPRAQAQRFGAGTSGTASGRARRSDKSQPMGDAVLSTELQAAARGPLPWLRGATEGSVPRPEGLAPVVPQGSPGMAAGRSEKNLRPGHGPAGPCGVLRDASSHWWTLAPHVPRGHGARGSAEDPGPG